MKKTLEGVVFMRSKEEIAALRQGKPDTQATYQDLEIPDGVIKWATQEAYDEYRKTFDSFCADVVISTRLPSGEPAVIASKRKLDKMMGGKWWMQGGAVRAYESIEEFIKLQAEKECGVNPEIQGIMGLFRTCDDKTIGSTTNVCYVGYIAYENIDLQTDGDHTETKLFTREEWESLPQEERHWYPDILFKIALETTPT